jgi:hypothetical protein
VIARIAWAILFGAALAFSAGLASAAQLLPVDEGAKDASFVAFRDELKRIIARKDAKSLMRIVVPSIKNSFGGDDGAVNFKKMWKPTDAKSPVWPVLALVVAMGGRFENKKTFVAPYVYSDFPDDLDGFETIVVTAKNAVMREQPKADAPVVRTLGYDILTIAKPSAKLQHEAAPDDWLEVSDADGKRGFVLQRELRSPIDFRAIFEKRKTSWRMTVLVVGD